MSGYELGYLAKPAVSYSPSKAIRVSGPAIVMVATYFNLAFCFLNTRHWVSINAAMIIVTQLILVVAAIAISRHRISASLSVCCIGVIGVALALKLLNPDVDLKILFDLAIGPAFVLLGMGASVGYATRMLQIIVFGVAALGLAEMYLTTWFQSVFDIWSYYISKGVIGPHALNYTGTAFFGSGERSESAGRTLLPGLLGSHRASSVFLEPVSMGNFPIICIAWLLSVREPGGRARLVLFGLVAFCIVLPDSRFAIACCIFMFVFSALGLHRSRALATCLPFAVLGALWILGSLNVQPGEHPQLMSDNFAGRLLYSGKLLASWGWSTWLGLPPSPVYVSDTGYAYVASNLSLPIAAFIWIYFTTARVATPEAVRMRGLIAVYVSTSLAIGDSMFSIKTAGLLWFLYGATQTIPASARWLKRGDAASFSATAALDRADVIQT